MSLSLGFVDMPSTGAVLTASTALTASTLGFGSADDRGQAVVDVMTVVFNDRGQGVSTVKERLTIQPHSGPLVDDTGHGPVAYRHQFQLKPGLYQVRVAARDSNTERVGSTMEWIEIPDLSGGALSMSSLILGEPPSTKRRGADVEVSTLPMEVNEGHRFKHDPRLRILTYIYNAVRSTAPPDVVLRIQVFRGDKVVVATPITTLKTEGVADLSRIPYFAELNMEGSPGGVYTLQVTAIDRAADTNTSQRATFEIE